MKLLLFLLILYCLPTYAGDCPDGTYFVQEHFRKSHYRNGIPVKGSIVTAHCKQYRNDGALIIDFKSKIPKNWPEKKEILKECSPKKQAVITKALKELPKFLTEIGQLKIYCSDKSVYPNNPAASAPIEKMIILYDSAFNNDIKRYLAHEMAHILYDRLSNQEKAVLHKISNWEQDSKGTFYTTKKDFSEIDGVNDPDEDFSNNLEHYLFNKKQFEKKYPSIYQWIEKHFGGRK